jgi:Mor family transcriptional regulator
MCLDELIKIAPVIIHRYVHGGATITQLSEEYKASKGDIKAVLKIHKVPLRPPYKRALSDIQAQDILEHYIPGSKDFGIAYFAKKYNVSINTINNLLQGRTYKHVHKLVARNTSEDTKDIDDPQ